MKKVGLITTIVFIIDRIIKIFISNNFKLNYNYEIIDNFFFITHCHNKGAAFSILNNNVLLLIAITIIVLFFILKFIKSKQMNKIQSISYGILLGGIISNLIDRIFYGYVIDYLDFIIFKIDFAIFNFADVCIILGAILIIMFDKGEKNENRN